MSKKVKRIVLLAFLLGALGGLTEYFSPSIKVDEESLLGQRESIEASALAPIVSAKGAILIDAKDGTVIYEKDADAKLYPASTTKIMTVLVALEMLDEIDGNMNSKVTIPKAATGIEGSSIYLKEGEEVTVEELFYGAMLQSGNDAATALALCFGGDIDSFAQRMNQKAKEIGCQNTNFRNPTGLFDEKHYTTARDLSRIGMEAMKNPAFQKIAGATSWQSDTTERNFVNKNKTVNKYDGGTGVKIGYTKKSGRTLVASAKREDIELIAVVLNDPDWFKDAYNMLDYGFQRKADG